MLKKTLTGVSVIVAACGLVGFGAGVAGAATPAAPQAAVSAPAVSQTAVHTTIVKAFHSVRAAQAANPSPTQLAKVVQMALAKLDAVQVPAGTPGAAQLAQAKAQLNQLLSQLPAAPLPAAPALPNLHLPEPLCTPLSGITLGLYNALHGLGLPDGTMIGLPDAPRVC